MKVHTHTKKYGRADIEKRQRAIITKGGRATDMNKKPMIDVAPGTPRLDTGRCDKVFLEPPKLSMGVLK